MKRSIYGQLEDKYINNEEIHRRIVKRSINGLMWHKYTNNEKKISRTVNRSMQWKWIDQCNESE